MTETILLQRDKLVRQHEEVFEIDEPDEKSLTPLMKASIHGHLEVTLTFSNPFKDSETTFKIWSES